MKCYPCGFVSVSSILSCQPMIRIFDLQGAALVRSSKIYLALWLCSGSNLPFHEHRRKAQDREISSKDPL